MSQNDSEYKLSFFIENNTITDITETNNANGCIVVVRVMDKESTPAIKVAYLRLSNNMPIAKVWVDKKGDYTFQALDAETGLRVDQSITNIMPRVIKALNN